jgi:hypothetical protein
LVQETGYNGTGGALLQNAARAAFFFGAASTAKLANEVRTGRLQPEKIRKESHMGNSRKYRFGSMVDCLDINGNSAQIPQGDWFVGELDAVTILADADAIKLDKAVFERLKAEGKAILAG